jgi:hypothetical protein
MLPLQTLRGVDMETKLCALPTCSAEAEKWGKREDKLKGKKIEKDFIFFSIYLYMFSFTPFEALDSFLSFFLFWYSPSPLATG